jgi:beta-galactosidase
VISASEDFALPDDAAAIRWADGLIPDGACVLAWYKHPHFGRWPAVTTRPVGKGRITYVGTVPGSSFAHAILRWACAGSRPELPASVTLSSATAADGSRLRFLHNWSWEPAAVTADGYCTDVLDGKRIEPGADIELSAWDVRVLLEE